jgi:hypothetical protein
MDMTSKCDAMFVDMEGNIEWIDTIGREELEIVLGHNRLLNNDRK